jgi:sugar phosphate isomerase/epimerase
MLAQLIETSVPVSSIHAPYPASVSARGIPSASLSLSSTDEAERQEAVRVSKKTIELAAKMGARVVILHMGEIPLNTDLEEKLRRLFHEGLTGSEVYLKVKEELILERSFRASQYLEQAAKSLDELSEYSQSTGIMLGLENRVYFREIPNINEMAELLNRVEGSLVGYWHDVGHAEVQQRLGFTPHEEWLIKFGGRMIGIHLHDVNGVSDHRVPGRGDVDWGMIAKYLPQEAIRTCEINQRNEEELVKEAIPFLRKVEILSG